MLTFCILKCLFSYPTIVLHQEMQGLGRSTAVAYISSSSVFCPGLLYSPLYLQTVWARPTLPRLFLLKSSALENTQFTESILLHMRLFHGYLKVFIKRVERLQLCKHDRIKGPSLSLSWKHIMPHIHCSMENHPVHTKFSIESPL